MKLILLEKDIQDDECSAIIIPEMYTKKIRLFYKAKIFIWWLSVDNNFGYGTFLKKMRFVATLPLRYVKNRWYYKNRTLEIIKNVFDKELYSFDKEDKRVTHLCASYYAFDYVSKRSKNPVELCIEPISKFFLESYKKEMIKNVNRESVVLFNPRKSGPFISILSRQCPDINFIPLQGMNQLQLIEKYKSAKLYVDFGPFPGAERIPKEAVLYGCAIMTGRRGASNFHGDVPIPDEYKFENPEKQMEDIVQKLRFMLNNYEKINSDFDEYRNTVLNLERNFIESLKKVFGQNRISGENV